MGSDPIVFSKVARGRAVARGVRNCRGGGRRMRRTSQKWYNMQQIDMSNEKPMVSAYPPRPLAEPRSGRYAGCKRAAGEVFGCIPHGCAGEAKLRREAARSAPEGTARGRARALR